MKTILSIIGAIFGGEMEGEEGAIVGFFLGLLLGAAFNGWRKIKDLQLELKKQKERVNRLLVVAAKDQPVAAPVVSSEIKADQSRPDIDVKDIAAGNGDMSPLPWSGSGSEDLPTAPAYEQGTPLPIESGDDLESANTSHDYQYDFFDKAINSVKTFFTTGNVVAKVGVIVLFFGVAFLVNYAAEHQMFPIELRLAGISAVGIAMLIIGWRLRITRKAYGLILQGGGIGVLYLTVYAAAKLYGLLPLGIALFGMVLMVGFSGVLAYVQDSKSLAVLGTTGGFLAPVLASTGQGSHVVLFSYYAILNAGIFGLAWFKAWRILNWIGFLFTFVIASLWGWRSYTVEHFNTTEPFLILFFLFYVGIAVLFAYRQPPKLKGLVDGTLVFGVPTIAFALQRAMVRDIPFATAWTAIAMSALYLLLANYIFKKFPNQMQMLAEAFLALAVIFGTLAIPFALDDGRWTAAAWAMEGAGLIWIGLRQQNLLTRCFGFLLQIGAALAFLTTIGRSVDALAIFNSAYIGMVLISIAGLITSYLYQRAGDNLLEWEKPLHYILLAWGIVWWLAAGVFEIEHHLATKYELNSGVLFLSVTALVISLLAQRLRWPEFNYVTAGLLPLLILAWLIALADYGSRYPFANLGWLSWPSAIVLQYLVLKFAEPVWQQQLKQLWHTGSMLLGVFIVTWFCQDAVSRISEVSNVWDDIIWVGLPGVAVIVLHLLSEKNTWPFQQYKGSYTNDGVAIIILAMLLWFLISCFQRGNPQPLPYISIFNPIELAQLFVLMVSAWWFLSALRDEQSIVHTLPPNTMIYTVSGLGFLWLNNIVARTVHFWGGVRFGFEHIIESSLFQTSISIVWTVTALIVMFLATRYQKRSIWFVGLALLGAVVVKLFLIDQAKVDEVRRIISFISVGVLFLVINYLAPIPPKPIESN